MSLIEVKNLTKIYHDGEVETPALRGVSLDIEDGEFVAIMGPSGSGKSTLLHILGFLDKHTAGDYRFGGKALADYTEEEVARFRNEEMGFIFQTFNLLRRTNVLENVKLPLLYSGVKPQLWEEKAIAAIKTVGMDHRLNHEPSQLSGGEQQRAAIARAIVNNPKVIFADDHGKDIKKISTKKKGKYVASIIIPGNLLSPGGYFVSAGIASYVEGGLDDRLQACSFSIKNKNNTRGAENHPAVLDILLDWETKKI